MNFRNTLQLYKRRDSSLLCGYWNNSPVEIELIPMTKTIPASEGYHRHFCHEYYIVLEGEIELIIEENKQPLYPNTVLMINPGERHQISWINPNSGARWMTIKEKSIPEKKSLY